MELSFEMPYAHQHSQNYTKIHPHSKFTHLYMLKSKLEKPNISSQQQPTPTIKKCFIYSISASCPIL